MGKLAKLIRNMRAGMAQVNGVKKKNSYFHYDLNNNIDAACPFGCAFLGAGLLSDYEQSGACSDLLVQTGLSRTIPVERFPMKILARHGVPRLIEEDEGLLSLWDIIVVCCDSTDMTLEEIVGMVERLDKDELFQRSGV